MFTAKPSASSILFGAIVPTIPKGALSAMLGLVGAVIMPHNLYLHSSLVLTRKIDTKDKNQLNEANIYNFYESLMSLVISFTISTSVIATFAVYKEKNANVELDLFSASEALAVAFGNSSKYIWAIGLLAAG
jgi:NRAMP (natural resistance-associated macrophage protein)-like metal ion transporter